MDFSIIIVSWNVKDRLRENLQALYASTDHVTFEVIVVDNASTDDTVSMLAIDFPNIRIIKNQKNLGFAYAGNQGLKVASGDYLILLNPDMKVEATMLVDLKKWLEENPQADVTGITLVDSSGAIIKHVRRFPKLIDQLMITLKQPHLFPSLLQKYIRVDFDYTQAAAVDSVRGAFFVIRRSALMKFGYLDERYFLWFEEVDYCRMVKNKGGQVWYTPAVTAIDYVGQSFAQVARFKKQNYFRKSMLTYFKKWHPLWQVIILSIAWWLALVIVWLGDVINLRSRSQT